MREAVQSKKGEVMKTIHDDLSMLQSALAGDANALTKLDEKRQKQKAMKDEEVRKRRARKRAKLRG